MILTCNYQLSPIHVEFKWKKKNIFSVERDACPGRKMIIKVQIGMEIVSSFFFLVNVNKNFS